MKKTCGVLLAGLLATLIISNGYAETGAIKKQAPISTHNQTQKRTMCQVLKKWIKYISNEDLNLKLTEKECAVIMISIQAFGETYYDELDKVKTENKNLNDENDRVAEYNYKGGYKAGYSAGYKDGYFDAQLPSNK